VLHKPLETSVAACAELNGICRKVEMPVKQSGSSVSGVAIEVLWSTDVGVQRARDSLRVNSMGSVQTVSLPGTGEKLYGWPEGTEVSHQGGWLEDNRDSVSGWG
jgi:hypothetical protein